MRTFVGALWVAALTAGTSQAVQPAETKAAEPRDVSALLEPIIAKHEVPGMVAMVVEGDRVVMAGAAGVRKKGEAERVTLGDRFHLGSCTKSMTATLCAMMAEEGALRWDETLEERFKADAAGMNEEFRGVTLTQLMHHRAGVPTALNTDGLWGRLWGFKGTATEARRLLMKEVTKRKPENPPGTKYEYANGGYAIAGLMAEEAAGKPWEDLIVEKLFKPLGITSAGFGAPGTVGVIDQPRGHRGNVIAEPGPGSDNPVAIAPGGRAHMTIGDWAKYVSLHLRGDKANPKRECRLLKPESFDRLHEPWKGESGGYAMGWSVPTRPWAKGSKEGDAGVVLTHSGSNTMWFAVTWLAPERDFAVLVCCNRGDGGDKATDEAAAKLIGQWGAVRSNQR